MASKMSSVIGTKQLLLLGVVLGFTGRTVIAAPMDLNGWIEQRDTEYTPVFTNCMKGKYPNYGKDPMVTYSANDAKACQAQVSGTTHHKRDVGVMETPRDLSLTILLMTEEMNSTKVPSIDAPPIDTRFVDAAPVDAPSIDAPLKASLVDSPSTDTHIMETSLIDSPSINASLVDMPSSDAYVSEALPKQVLLAQTPSTQGYYEKDLGLMVQPRNLSSMMGNNTTDPVSVEPEDDTIFKRGWVQTALSVSQSCAQNGIPQTYVNIAGGKDDQANVFTTLACQAGVNGLETGVSRVWQGVVRGTEKRGDSFKSKNTKVIVAVNVINYALPVLKQVTNTVDFKGSTVDACVTAINQINSQCQGHQSGGFNEKKFPALGGFADMLVGAGTQLTARDESNELDDVEKRQNNAPTVIGTVNLEFLKCVDDLCDCKSIPCLNQ